MSGPISLGLVLAALLLGLLALLGVVLRRLSRITGEEKSRAVLLEGLRGDLVGRVDGLERRNAELQTILTQQLGTTQHLLEQRLSGQEQSLREQLSHQAASLQSQTGILQRHMEGTQATLAQVTEKMGMVQQTSLRMAELGKDIEGLQRLLRAPKARGELGELGLETILRDILPKDRVVYQYAFADGRKVDAMVLLDRGLLPIDAKFPMEDFQRYLEAEEDDRPKARRAFLANLKKKIDDIAKLYVRPGEGTLPLALMYLPAESLYYEAFVVHVPEEEDLWHYAYERSVLPLSPGTLTAYLKTVALGLKAAAVEQNARQVLDLLATLERDLRSFEGGFETLGRHLANAHQKYDEGQRALQRLSGHLERARDLGSERPGDSGE